MTKTIDHLTFVRDLKEFVRMSDELYDDWKLQGDDGDEIYALKKSVTDEGLHTEHHITYSPSYKVPVIYFRIYDAGGQLITDPKVVLETLMCISPSSGSSLESVSASRLEALTLMPHPFNQTPYFQIHPCKTSEWMANCQSNNYIATWLSHLAPIVGLPGLPNQYFQDS